MNKLYKIFDEVRPDIVIHLAAQPLVFESYYKPFDTLFTNILGTLNIFELSNMLLFLFLSFVTVIFSFFF